MDCKNCELKQRQFYCANCLRFHLRDFRLQIQHFAADRDEQVARWTAAMTGIGEARSRRACIAMWEERVRELTAGVQKLRKENESARERLKALREILSERRRRLELARAVLSPNHEHATQKEKKDLSTLSLMLSRARSGLVQELVEVFNVVEMGGRPSVGGRTGAKGEWTIGNLVLPVPGDIRRYPPTHINAVITHTIHFLSLLTFYLGIKLPFEISWSEAKLGVGQPWIGAGRGAAPGSWAKWVTKHPLHLSSSTEPYSPSPSTPEAQQQVLSVSQTLSDSYTPTNPPAAPSSFTTAFAMLLYDVCYLAHTQSVDVPLSQAGDALSNLWAVCCSSELGRHSHSTFSLPTRSPIPPFALDFAQLLQVTMAGPASRKPFAAKFKPSMSVNSAKQGKEKTKILEEEEEWHMVEDM